MDTIFQHRYSFGRRRRKSSKHLLASSHNTFILICGIMRVYCFPAALCGLSLSSSLLCHYHRRCPGLILRQSAKITTISRHFQLTTSSSSIRYCHHRLHLNLFPFHSSPENTKHHDYHIQHTRRQQMGWGGNNKSTNRVRGNHRCTARNSRNNYSTQTTEDEKNSLTNGNTADKMDFANNNHSSSRRSPVIRYFYNDVYEVKLPPRHRFPMGKYRQVRTKVQDMISDLPQEQQERVDWEFQISPLSTLEELSTTHDTTYIQRFLVGDQTEKEQRNVGFPWSTEGVDRALSSVGGTLAAACFVCNELRQRQKMDDKKLSQSSSSSSTGSGDVVSDQYSPCWAAHIAGGTHHAFYDYGEGFSVFSDMAVTANVVLERYPDIIKNKILMIDLDVHQGNGNAVLFQQQQENSTTDNGDDDDSNNNNKSQNNNADRVFTFSMHCCGNYFSPKQESDLDIELPIGCSDQAYLMTLNHWLKRFRIEHNREKDNKYKWDLIIFQAGVDVLEDDRLGRMSLSSKGVERRNELVYEFAHDLKIPLVICMGGGYPKRDDGWKSIIDAHSNVYVQAHQFLHKSTLSQS